MKRAVAIILTFVFCMCSALCVGANEEISVIIDGVNQNRNEIKTEIAGVCDTYKPYN